MTNIDRFDGEPFVCQVCNTLRPFDHGSGDCQACAECCMCRFTMPGFRCFDYADTKPKPFPSAKAVEQHREFWAGIAKTNGWYAEPFFIQVWYDETDGTISDTVANPKLTADLFIPDTDDCDDECCIGDDDDE